MTPRRQDISLFVDWNSQIANGGQAREDRVERRTLEVAEYVTKAVESALPSENDRVLYRASVRLYYGWHKGLTATDTRAALIGLYQDGLLPTVSGKVAFDWSNMFGDTLLDAFDHRKHRRLGVHLPDTLRLDTTTGGRIREKMVDTAMACDILCSARSDPSDWRIVMAEDDDVIPSVFVAEKWSKDKGGKSFILRDRSAQGFLALDGLLKKLERA